MKRLLFTILALCGLLVGLQAQNTNTTNQKGVTSQGQLDTVRNTRVHPMTQDEPIQRNFVDQFGKTGQRPGLSPYGQRLKAVVKVSGSIATCSISWNQADMTTNVADSGDYVLPVIERGVCYGLEENPTLTTGTKAVYPYTSGDGFGDNFWVSITELEPSTTYYVRAYAVCVDDTIYSDNTSFTTLARTYCTVNDARTDGDTYTAATGGLETLKSNSTTEIVSVADQDNHTYDVVQIGGQCWMAENMRATKYASNLSVTDLVLDQQASCVSSCLYAYPYGAESAVPTYGLLYNWYASMATATADASNGAQGICPKGWHVPSSAEFGVVLTSAEADTAAGKLSKGCNWYESDSGAKPGNFSYASRNSSGFGAVPAGQAYGGGYSNCRYAARFWASTSSSGTGKDYLSLENNNVNSVIGHEGPCGYFSVRCVRDVALAMTIVGDGYISSTAPATVIYTATPSNGINGYTYTWSASGGTVTPNGNECSITYSTAGTYTVTCTAVGYGITVTNTTSIEAVTPNMVPLTFEAKKANVTVTFNKGSDVSLENPVEFRINSGEWTTYSSSITLPNIGDKVSFRNTNVTYATSRVSGNYCTFSCSNDCYIYGNVMSLIDKENFATSTSLSGTHTFCYLFRENNTLYNHAYKELKLPATELQDYCYEYMFQGCRKLTIAPALPAETIKQYCYNHMFDNCISLTSAPALPATAMKDCCYLYMFAGCSNLTTAPALPATTLAYSCYEGMFNGCSKLTVAPALPVTSFSILSSGVYAYMFKGCTSLTTAPELPATTLSGNCYNHMFEGCTNLTSAPMLPAPTLTGYCYKNMFSGCTHLNKVTCLATDITAQECTTDWLNGVAATGTFIKDASMTGWTIDSPHGIPQGWTTTYYTGSGTSADPYLIYNLDDWNAFAAVVNGGTGNVHAKQMDNISGVSTIIGSSSHPFKGSYDGQGYTISNVNISGTTNVGLFGYVNDASALIENVVVASGTITGTSVNVGSIVGQLNKGTVRYCANYATVSSSVESARCGGVVGWMKSDGGSDNVVTKCINYGNVSAPSYAGGIVGSLGGGSVTYCQNFGTITATSSTYGSAGGIAGWRINNTTINISNNHNGGDLNIKVSGYKPLIGNDNQGYSYPNNTYLSSLTLTVGSTFYSGSGLSSYANGATAVDENPAGIAIGNIVSAGPTFGKFTVNSNGNQVNISKGNLQYQASTNRWRFAEQQYDYVGDESNGNVYAGETKCNNANISSSYTGWIDLFGWGTGNAPTTATTSNSNYSNFTDWGVNAISNGGNTANQWRTLTNDEWGYLFNTRTNAANLRTLATVNGVTGLIVMPDGWSGDLTITLASYSTNTLTQMQWKSYEAAGCVFLPAAGHRFGTSIIGVSSYGNYHSSTPSGSNGYDLYFDANGINPQNSGNKCDGRSVRLVKNVLVQGSISYSKTAVEKMTTEPAFTNALTKVGDGTVTYSKTGANICSVNANTGEVTLNGSTGTCTIKATVTNSPFSSYATTIATYTLTVKTPLQTPLTFEAKTAGATVTFKKGTNAPAVSNVEFSRDGGATWETYTYGTGITLDSVGDKVSFQGINATYSNGNADANSCEFSCNNDCYIYGNIMSLINKNNFATNTSLTGNYAFCRLFYNIKKIYNLPTKPLKLPAITLTENCYRSMFSGCSNLTSAPALPATTLANYCYYAMFNNCSNLLSAPVLPATTLAERCYQHMFYHCTSLTSAPALPATTLVIYCYESMFLGCTSLTSAPALPATTLANYCYQDMFNGCTSLTSAPAQLPATTLAIYCYNSMFVNCSNLTTAPVLPATKLVQNCYSSMFYGCKKLNSVTCLATNISNPTSTLGWLYYVASTGTFTKAAGVNWSVGDDGIPYGWTVVSQ